VKSVSGKAERTEGFNLSASSALSADQIGRASAESGQKLLDDVVAWWVEHFRRIAAAPEPEMPHGA